MTFEETMKLAIETYKSGRAVVLKDESGRVIWGAEDLSTFGVEQRLELPPVHSEQWQASEKHWQEILRGARQGWLENRKP